MLVFCAVKVFGRRALFIGDKWEGKCKGVRLSPIQGFLSLRGGWCDPILVGGLTYMSTRLELYRIAKKAI